MAPPTPSITERTSVRIEYIACYNEAEEFKTALTDLTPDGDAAAIKLATDKLLATLVRNSPASINKALIVADF